MVYAFHSRSALFVGAEASDAMTHRPALELQSPQHIDTDSTVYLPGQVSACMQVGLTMTAASVVVFAELAWVPGELIQVQCALL